MSSEKATSPCSKFQANIFNKSKCQNCFKSRELHLSTDQDMEQAKPIYGGWLCLAPEGTDFDNPMQRSRKWQRRFFILYERGSLSFALDELPSTLPQGTLNMNLCTDITDAEPRTGQRNALCIVTPEQEIFIRGDNKDIINGWSEQLAVYLRTNKQNQKKKRKVEPVATQEPSPAKMAATDPGFSSSESSAVSSRWQEDQLGGGPHVTSVWTITERTPAGNTSAYLCPVSKASSTLDTLDTCSSIGSPVLDLTADGNTDPGRNNTLAESDKKQNWDRRLENISSFQPIFGITHDSTAERILGLEAPKKEQGAGAANSRKGRSDARTNKREKLQSCGDITQLSVPPPQRRAKSLDSRTSETINTPDLLNFKKGWMVKLDENDQWKKYWFVLSTDSLRYYKDSVAEEASDLEGEIDLTKCYNVSEYQVQRNYGFQIHTAIAVYTLSAMTAGIRRNWIQALMKNVHPANAPDVTSLHVPCSPAEPLPRPDVTQDSPSADMLTDRDSHPKPRTMTERQPEGRQKAFDWAESRSQHKLTLETDPQTSKTQCSLGDLERRRRREERRRRYESMLSFSLGWEEIQEKTVDDSDTALSPKSQQRVEEEIESCWRQVEKTVFRLEKTVPLYVEAKESEEIEKLLDSYREWVDDLKAKVAESEQRRLELEAQLSTAARQQQQLDPLVIKADFCPWDTNEKSSNFHTQSLKHAYEEGRELLPQENTIKQGLTEQLSSPSLAPQTPSIWLHDTEGGFQDLGDLFTDHVATPLSPSSDNTDLFSPGDGQAVELNLEVATSANLNPMDRADSRRFLTSDSQIDNSNDSGSILLEKSEEAEANSLNCCVEQHMPPDQTVVRRLSQQVTLLTSQNEALNQRNQEMLNQLTEADREIERLKAELSSRHAESNHLPEVEKQGKPRVEDLERELSLRNQELLEAQTLITSLEESLREAEALLQLSLPAETEDTGQVKSEHTTKAEGYLLRCFEATEAKLMELERQLDQSELNCRELQAQKSELKEAEQLYSQRAAVMEADIRRLNQELEEERIKNRNKSVSGEERIRQVIEGMVMRLKVLGKLLEVIEGLDLAKESEEDKPTLVSQLMWEEGFWTKLLTEVQRSPHQSNEENSVEILLRQVTEHLILEKQVLLLGHSLLSDTENRDQSEACEGLDIIWNNANIRGTDESMIFKFSKQVCDVEHFKAMTQMEIALLNNISSSVGTSPPEKFQLMADRLYDFQFAELPWSSFIHSAATEALYCRHLSSLQSKHVRDLEDAKHRLNFSLKCSNCVKLMEENRELKERFQQVYSLGDKQNMCCQTDETYPWITNAGLQENAADGFSEENVQQSLETTEVCMEIPVSGGDGQLGIREISDEHTQRRETVPSDDMAQVSVLRRRVEELEEILSVITEEMKEEFDEKMSSVQTRHKEEIEKLKGTCDRGFASMQECHLKVVEGLQHRHQQEVERLLLERDRLLEEECTATATAIEAIRNAHRLELERELQKRCQSENSSGNLHLEDIYRQHSEELASYQRELEVLSQQFSLKCLENGHLVQAVDAERKALCQCQQENQDLRTRNQELSGHLAAEITRLCSLAKQDDLLLTQGMDVYEMEITLRVKESEVQCLKQEITSLKDELQSAQRDKRNAAKKYKDMYTELSIVRAKTEREIEELRENLSPATSSTTRRHTRANLTRRCDSDPSTRRNVPSEPDSVSVFAVMEVSSQDPSLMAMDLSKSYNPLTRSHTEAMDLARKPEWYHRRPSSCSTDIASSYRSRASSSFNALSTQPAGPVHCRDIDQAPDALGNYMNSSLAPGLDLYHDGVHSNLWHPGFYRPDQTGTAAPESSGGEESDSGSDVIFLVSSAKEPLLCSPFMQDSVRHIVEPLSPTASSLDEGRGCYHLPQPLSSPSPDSSYSEESSDSSLDIPVHHTRPVVLLSDLSAVYGNHAESPVDISSDDSDVVEVSVSDKKKRHTFPCKKNAPCKKETLSENQGEKAPPREVRRSNRIRKSVSEMPQFTCSGSRHSLRRQVKNDAVGIYNESCDSEDMIEYAVRLSSSEADESVPQPNVSQRVSSNTEESDVNVQAKETKSQQRDQRPHRKVSSKKSVTRKRKKSLTICKTKKQRKNNQKQKHSTQHHNASSCTKVSANKKSVMRRKRKWRTQTGPSALFSPREPEIKLKYANVKEEKKDKKSDSFFPFVHMEKRMCTVVNFQEEETAVWSSRGRLQTAIRSLSGFVPNTSCFQLGRLSSESRSQAALLCCLCGQTANVIGLGDLHGPYYRTNPSLDYQNCKSEQKEEDSVHGLTNSHSVNSSGGGCDGYDCSAGKSLPATDNHSHPKLPLHLDDCWMHEDCVIWTTGVFLVRGKLYGLEEAARLAQETVCSTCQQAGAIMGCFQKGCPRNYHYRCAIQSGCVLSEENFSMRCPEHKNKPFISVNRKHKR
ncbi:hypothetical protein Q5P01_016903 [Channa striata]|uniref:Myosin phosphatase Rho-interacting protein-like n=1 Tax=Channa striata TaxID=64152 RepID=A0AA88SAX2_CHASR|nr:hypothetical protein Q5P01_016903 [Channa striata]